MNGVSKKFCILALAFSQLSALAAGSTEKLPYAYLITGCFIAYLALQGWLDKGR